MKKNNLIIGGLVIVMIGFIMISSNVVNRRCEASFSIEIPNVKTEDEKAPLLKRERPTPGEQVIRDIENASSKEIGRGAVFGAFNLLSYHAYDKTYEDDDDCDITDICCCCWIPKLISKMCGCGYGWCEDPTEYNVNIGDEMLQQNEKYDTIKDAIRGNRR